MESVGFDGQTGPFSSSNKPKRRSVKTLVWSQLVPTGKRAHLQVQMSLKTDISNGEILSQRISVKTLVIKPVGSDGKMGPFSSSNELERRYTLILLSFVCYVHSAKIIIMESVGFDGQTGPFSSSNKPKSSQLVPMGKHAHFQVPTSPEQLVTKGKSTYFSVQTSPKVGKHPFDQFLCAIVQGFLTLLLEHVDPDGQTSPFSNLNDPQRSNGVSWSRLTNGPIFKFKRALKKNYGLFFAKIFYGRLLRP
ncbi:hypothetical protein H5410_051854 [Solanum commersonii]|uniref:Uncharacterized protein n=1 Tax=Solanum commersonii TaxID=4109 RepID=A0A9J5WZL4_SOLCO|nr:hypothetical protein H5410_051854 [Solanum commersonii]